jgi:hypothetical protein
MLTLCYSDLVCEMRTRTQAIHEDGFGFISCTRCHNDSKKCESLRWEFSLALSRLLLTRK